MRAATDRPNIILINCDDLGYGDLSCYGSERNRTPSLDRLAAEGTRFTDFYMASPVCSPSRGAMMTGCYAKRIGFGDFDGRWVLFPGQPVGLDPSEITVARVLKDQGYATKLVGKWHCGDQPEFLPTAHGFDEYFGIPFSNDMGRQLKADGTLREYPPLPLLRDGEVIQQQPDQAAITERYTEDCVRYIRAHRDEPFFLYLAHMHVHLPLYVAERFLKASQNGRYGACVEAIDWCTSVIVDELARQGLTENTMIVFTSDNGSRAGTEGGSNGPLRGRKGTTFEGGMRLPCIVRWPGVVPAGRVTGEIISSIDFMPTFAALAGTEAPTDRIIDGRDFSALLRGEDGATSPRECFYYYAGNNLQAVRVGRWKLFANGELYDLIADIAESIDVAAANAGVVAELAAHLDAARADLGDAATEAAGANCRPLGRVAHGRPLTEYDQTYPYIIAEYDLTDAG